jgi:hypothetical protein
MICDLDRGNPTTADKLARELVLRFGEGAYYWTERHGYADRFTDLQIDAVDIAVHKHWCRVRKFLRLDIPVTHYID